MQTPRPSAPGLERFVLALALLVPLTVIALVVAQIPGVSIGRPSSVVYADSPDRLVPSRPAPSNSGPPPTLAVPTATPKPTETPLPAPPAVPTQETGRHYTVQPGDELKQIAAQYNTSIWRIIDTNNIPNPDSLRIGQVLSIPDN